MRSDSNPKSPRRNIAEGDTIEAVVGSGRRRQKRRSLWGAKKGKFDIMPVMSTLRVEGVRQGPRSDNARYRKGFVGGKGEIKAQGEGKGVASLKA